MLFVALLIAGCGREVATTADSEARASSCGESGYLVAQLSGTLQTSIDWSDAELQCQSMLRPDDRGVRLRFSGKVGQEHLTLIVAVPDLEAGMTGRDIDAVVTLTVEGSGRFFTTPNLGACWTDIAANEPLETLSATHRVAGELHCVGPLGEFNGDAFVEIADLRFSGVALWGPP